MNQDNNPGRGYARLINVLEALASHSEGYTLSELSRVIDTPKSTVHIIIKHLLESGHISLHEDTKRFSKGPALVRLAFRIANGIKVQQLAIPFLEQLSRETTQDVYLATRSGTQVIYVSKVEGTHSLRLNIGLGIPKLMHCTASGKVFLAWDTDNLLDQVVQSHGLPPVTHKTITSRDTLEEELGRIRDLGYSITNEEGLKGVYGIAVPIWNHEQRVEAAVHISCFKELVLGKEERLINACVATAKSISEVLGGSVPSDKDQAGR